MTGHKASLSKFSVNLRKLRSYQPTFLPTTLLGYKSTRRKKKLQKHKLVKNKHNILNNKWITEEIKEKIKKYLETNDNENVTIQNLWDIAKAVLRRKFVVIQAYLRKQEKSQINNLSLQLKQLEKDPSKCQWRQYIIFNHSAILKLETTSYGILYCTKFWYLSYSINN